MRITKAWVKQAKSRIAAAQSELCSIRDIGGINALRMEFSRRFPHAMPETYPSSEGEYIRQMFTWELERILPSAITD